MLPKTSIPKLGALPSARAASTRASIQSRSQARVLSAPAYAARRQQHFLTSLAFVTAAAGIATVSQYYLHDGALLNSAHAEAPPADQPDIQFEKRRKRGANKDEDRDLASSQHLQVRKSWENPGVYACGSNTGKVVAPDSDASFIKTPRRIPFFDGKLLRDIKLDKNFGVAIDEQGNLLQWGVDYSRETTQPTLTLKGKNLVKLAISKDRILGLSSSGTVYSLPVSAADQAVGTMPTESSWIPFWSSTSNISYRTITPTDMSYSERVSSIDSGLEHALLLTSKGRLFSMASATDSYPTRGQLGVPGISWDNKPNGPYYQPHELTTLRGFNISKIACGDYHSIVADTDGRVFAFGNNTSGQLGFDYNTESAVVDTPALLPLQKLYAGSSQVPVVTSVAAGGANSFLTVDATRVASRNSADNRNVGRITADTFACGAGIYGSLGNSRWTHVQGTPAKIPSLSGLFEYDETANAVIPIRLASISAGNKHVAAVMDNVAHTGALNTDGETWWGRDIVFWGGNEHYQIGTGKRNNLNTPTYIQPLDQVAERKVRGKEEHRFQITPRSTVRLADGRKVSMEQRVECGRDCTAIYSGL
jgi:alpha-tubulin suppressor-like RCC1 family protein